MQSHFWYLTATIPHSIPIYYGKLPDGDVCDVSVRCEDGYGAWRIWRRRAACTIFRRRATADVGSVVLFFAFIYYYRLAWRRMWSFWQGEGGRRETQRTVAFCGVTSYPTLCPILTAGEYHYYYVLCAGHRRALFRRPFFPYVGCIALTCTFYDLPWQLPALRAFPTPHLFCALYSDGLWLAFITAKRKGRRKTFGHSLVIDAATTASTCLALLRHLFPLRR